VFDTNYVWPLSDFGSSILDAQDQSEVERMAIEEAALLSGINNERAPLLAAHEVAKGVSYKESFHRR